ncbi:hypothetical protein SCP_1402010 [Sparassis crispa]|uniref:Uncharacterized protein n=1 Tax=Sparassis crispa TaxID=139825 RepID=A0A401H2X7_9APHY|nr:hypothetical protein SCP_1402010 [Sparassis crispa]GBE88796.1 hypothetical protein SCP_1402010 [Sparassis crispa]
MLQGFLSFIQSAISSTISSTLTLIYAQPEVNKLISKDVKLTGKDDLTNKYKHRHVQALLASTNTKNDHWMAVEFAALNALLPCNPKTSRWYCPHPIRPDAVSDILSESAPFETVLFDSSPGGIAGSFWDGLVQAGQDLSSEDTLVVALIGAQPWGSSYKLSPEGQDILSAADFIAGFENFKCKIVFIIPCGDAGHWRRPRWTVLTVAESTGEPHVFTDIYRTLHGQHPICPGSSSGSLDSPRGELSVGHSIVPNVKGTREVIDIFEWFDDLKDGDLPSCTSIHLEIASYREYAARGEGVQGMSNRSRAGPSAAQSRAIANE